MRLSWLDQVLGSRPPADDRNPRSGSRVYRLASDLPESWFTATIQAWWLPGEPGHEVLVFRRLRELGNAVTVRHSVLDAAVAQDALNSSFAALREIPDIGVQLTSAYAALGVAKDHLDFAERKASVERQTALDAASLEATRARLTKLRDLFFGDSAMARLWWSNGEPDRLLRVADNTGAFDTVLSLVGESGAGSAQADKIASLIERFLTDLGSSHRELLIAQLARVFASYQRSELAEELKRAD